MTFRTPTIGNMTFRPAARCGLDVGGNLRHLVGSAWSGGIYLSIAGRFGRGFLIWVKEGSLPGGRREREMFRVGVPPTARRRAATTGPAWSGCLAYRVFGESFHRHVIVITPSRHGPCDLPSSSGASSEGDSVLGSVFKGPGSALEDAIRFSEMGDCGQRRKKRNLASKKQRDSPKSAQAACPGDISKKGE